MISLSHIQKVYHTGDVEFHALNDISLEIKEGEFLAIMGSSGSGKSTLLHILGCMDSPTGGEYRFEDTLVSDLKPAQLDTFRKKKMGYVFQQFALMKQYTVFENVEIPLIADNVPKKKRRELVNEALEKMKILDLADKLPTQISGGQQQRVAIARALLSGGKVLLADEPTGALDKKTGTDIMNVIKELNEDGMTIIMVTHDERIAGYADRVVRIEDGYIVE